MNKNIYFSSVLGFCALFAACTGATNKDSALEKEETTPTVKLATVRIQPVAQLQEYTATVEPEVKNNIAPNSPVRIDRILVEVGDQVKKGQRLVQMDAANLRQIKLQLDNQETEFKRTDELYKVGGVSKSEWEAAKMSLDVRRTSYENLLENTSLESPINGIITARNYDNGDMYGGANPVLVVEQIRPVKLLINVSETYFAQIKKGMEVNVTLDVYPNEKFTGKVSLVYPTINTSSRTFPVEVQLANQDQRVRPGMFARVVVDFGTVEHVVVPDLAIVKQAGSGDRYVYVYNNGRVSYKKVELGRRLDTQYELISGIEDNAQVVVAGQARLLDNMEVQVEK
ncbi:MAG: efflux RND transporter periplasmic adaptor subunit [Prevotellaceae bacterium]|jgi:RND family efflux transporter MFP subunit|nr:efflux RND transporter periplasmic adaptor subunit [Prevotellaceae bacterium]